MFRVHCIRPIAVLVVVLFAKAIWAQNAESKPILGTVRNSRGEAIPGARVSLHLENSSKLEDRVTDEEGKFRAPNLRGNLTIRVHKAGCQDAEQTLKMPMADVEPVVISLECAAGAATANGMQFSDNPDFTVAGITDWTAAGGHGSDVNLRASESLAKDTRGLGSRTMLNHDRDLELESRLRAAVVKNLSDFAANCALGEFCLRERRFEDAIRALENAHALNASDYDAAYDLARAYEGAGQHDKAANLVRTLLPRNDKPELHRLLGDVEEALDDPLAAEHEYERAVQLDPSEENYFAWGGELLVHRAVEAAVEVLTKGSAAFPKSERMLATLGAALYAHGAYEEAAKRMCEASDLNVQDIQPYLFLGKMEQASPRSLPGVEEKLERFLRNDPENALANFYYAIALLRRSDAENVRQAETLLRNAVQHDPKFAEAYLQLGVLLAKRGETEGAKTLFGKAVAADAKFPDPHFRLAQIYERAGDKQKAAQELQTFERLKQSDAAQVEQRRREIRQFVVVLKNPPPESVQHP
jgi:tetratricopeptide (TPR) repeat protein